jgi:hypothetical protein
VGHRAGRNSVERIQYLATAGIRNTIPRTSGHYKTMLSLLLVMILINVKATAVMMMVIVVMIMISIMIIV